MTDIIENKWLLDIIINLYVMYIRILIYQMTMITRMSYNATMK